MTDKEIENIILQLQPYYSELNSSYSKSYLKGSCWYVGENLLEWWKKSNTIRYYSESILKLKNICEMIIFDINNKKLLLINE
jgi:hypothetical protein